MSEDTGVDAPVTWPDVDTAWLRVRGVRPGRGQHRSLNERVPGQLRRLLGIRERDCPGHGEHALQPLHLVLVHRRGLFAGACPEGVLEE
jgi:hypothetical protein